MTRRASSRANKAATADNTLRIIGGEWRSRKLQFPDVKGLRPTSGKIRETLFNWLGHQIIGANILDMFAGSGALGFEAISRGAASVVMVEKDRRAAHQLKENCQILQSSKAQVVNADSIAWSAKNIELFDLVFLDPPFAEEMLKECLELCKKGLVKLQGLVYLEAAKDYQVEIPVEFKVVKEKSSGNVRYQLLQRVK
ncbi:MAG: 16S rRNA (guanine(966)-N(2))-methyltransferase RsmD [Gammaproteobacteria bacterium]|nr:MAG: 16S rRNA (guanine(966)-N(2))-methyltransferase RsmD [Gammaproteobacteria bacterium]